MTLVSLSPPPFPCTIPLAFRGSLVGTPVSHSPHATTTWLRPQQKRCFTNTRHSGAELPSGVAWALLTVEIPLYILDRTRCCHYVGSGKRAGGWACQDPGSRPDLQGAVLGGFCGTMDNNDSDNTAVALPLRANIIIQATVIKTKQQGIICIISTPL